MVLDPSDLLQQGLLIGFLLFLSGFFSGSETALFSLSWVDLEKLSEKNHPRGALVRRLLDEPRKLLVTILVGNESVNISTSIFVATIISALIGTDDWLVVTLAGTAVVTPLLLVFGEITPKTIAVRYNERFATTVARPLQFFSRVILPVRWVLSTVADVIVRPSEGKSENGPEGIEKEEFRALIDMGEKDGVLDESEGALFRNVFEFGDTLVSEIMTPRTDMESLHVEVPLTDVLGKVIESHFSRIPVYGEDKDDVVGILYAKDLLQKRVRSGEVKDLATLLRKPFFVPLTKKAVDLFTELRREMIHLAIVVDEYGGMAGMVTMEDLLEELFGEIMDETDSEEMLCREIGDRAYLASAMLPVEDFNEIAGIDLPTGQVDTLGGFVLSLFGRVPVQGETIEHKDVRFHVKSVAGPRILEVEAQIIDPEESEPGEEEGK